MSESDDGCRGKRAARVRRMRALAAVSFCEKNISVYSVSTSHSFLTNARGGSPTLRNGVRRNSRPYTETLADTLQWVVYGHLAAESVCENWGEAELEKLTRELIGLSHDRMRYFFFYICFVEDEILNKPTPFARTVSLFLLSVWRLVSQLLRQLRHLIAFFAACQPRLFEGYYILCKPICAW